MARTTKSDDVRTHRRILATLSRLARTHGPGVHVQALANGVHKDPRTVRRHLDLMAEHHDIVYLDLDRTIVARLKDLERVIKAERAREEREELLYWSASSFARLAWGQEP